MNSKDVRIYCKRYLERSGKSVSDTALDLIVSPEWLVRSTLSRMENPDVRRNLKIYLDDLISSNPESIISSEKTLNTLRGKFCKLPPFCKNV